MLLPAVFLSGAPDIQGLQRIGRRKMAEGTEDKVKGKVDEVAGKVRGKVGDATDNEEMEIKGKIQETKGKARQKIGKIKDKAP